MRSGSQTDQTSLFDSGTRSGLEVRQYGELSSSERELVGRSGLGDLAPVEAWTARGTNREMSYATHGIFRYFGKFPPPVAAHLIAEHTDKGDTVCDPMCGSGTTGVECVLSGRRGVLYDVNPLGLLVSRVKARYIDRGSLEGSLGRVLGRYVPDDRDGGLPVGLKDPLHWFLPGTMASLRGLRSAIDEEDDPALKDFLMLSLCGCIRRVSRATSQQGRLFLDVETAEPDALPFFTRRAEVAMRGISSLPRGRNDEVRVEHADLQSMSSEDVRAGLVIVHPPYFNAYKYSRINSLELAWLGCDPGDVRKEEVREYFKTGKPEKVGNYVSDMSRALGNAFTLVRPGGTLALMIGDTILGGDYIPVTTRLLEAAGLESVSLAKVVVRVPMYTEASWVASQRRDSSRIGIRLHDFILVFEKRR